MKNHFAQTLILCSASLSLFIANPAAAQTAGAQKANVETLTVIGSRQAYKGDFTELETPQAELEISTEVLQDAGALNLVQALDLSASVARQNNFGGLWNSFAVRGFVGDENLPSNYLVNGFNAGRGFGGPRDLSGIEAVEVLKGPRAALFGRGEPGGTINLVTKRPTFEKAGYIQLSAASFNAYRTDLDWTSPLSDELAVRIVGFYEDAESFRDTVETTKHGLSPSLTWLISPQSQLTYELEYSKQEIPFDRGIAAIDGQLGLIPENRFLGEPGDGPIKTDVLGHQIEFQHEFSDDWSALLGYNFRDTSLEGFATENGFGGVDDNGDLGRFRRYRDYDANYQVFRAEINGSFDTAGLSHRLIIGLDSDQFKNDQVFLRIRDKDDPEGKLDQSINVFNPVYGAYPLPMPNPNTDRLEIQESVGVYIQDQMSITDKFNIRIGARFDGYQQSLENRRIEPGNPSRLSEYSESRVSPQLGLVYKATDAFSLYAVYGENFRPLSGATDENELKPNLSKSTEAGIKFALNDGALRGTLAIFDVAQSNISTVDADFNATALGEAGSQGIEFDINGNLTETLSIWASYAHIVAETKNAYNDPNFGVEVPAGASLLNVPENQFSLQLVQQMQLAGKELNLIGGLLYVDDRNGFFSEQNFRLPSYTTARVAANYQVSQSFLLGVEINNLFDEKHYTNSFADVWVQPGAPRNARLFATFEF